MRGLVWPTAPSQVTEAELAALPPARRAFGDFVRRFVSAPGPLVALGVVVVVALAAAVAPLLQTSDPFRGGPDALLPPGTPGHLLGTDQLGRDVWSGLVAGTRVSLLVGFAAAAMATLVGTAVGAVAGYVGSAVDAVLMRVTEFFQTLPRLVVALVVVALFGSSVTHLIVVIALLAWPQTARVVRAGVRSVRTSAFVEAAKVSGMPSALILVREILPNVLPSIVVVASLDVAEAILTEAALSFFGLGDPNLMSWGGMLQQAQQYLRQAWWMALFPGLAIAAVVLAFNILGDGLNDALNPRLRGKRR
jgi:peptide/nickel transport system permease protein